ncbi:MAG: hypothetical protein HYX55_00880 [Chloroflexi bacterium]|nr:hypothetical protein [Chloroflexota bacterium]
MSVVLFGDGRMHAYDDQGELDCYWNGGAGTTTCTGHYYWIAQMYPNGQLPVNVTIAPTVDTWACLGADGPPCNAIGAPLVTPHLLSNLEVASTGYSAHLASSITTTVSNPGPGSGKVTSSPSGLNCAITSGATSGTCQATSYSKTTLQMAYIGTPADGNDVCVVSGQNCGAVGEVKTNVVNYASSGTGGTSIQFGVGHPILTGAASGQGSVVSSPPGISCPSTCSTYFAPTSNVTLHAAAKSGQVFQGWTGAFAGYGSTCNLTLGTTDVSTVAVFSAPATPAPTGQPTIRPTGPPGTPSASHPAPSSQPRSNPLATPAPRATTAAGSTPVSSTTADSSAGADLPGATGPIEPGGSSRSDDASTGGVPASSTVATRPAANPAASGPDMTILILIGVIVALALGLGLGLGLGLSRRRTGRGTPSS